MSNAILRPLRLTRAVVSRAPRRTARWRRHPAAPVAATLTGGLYAARRRRQAPDGRRRRCGGERRTRRLLACPAFDAVETPCRTAGSRSPSDRRPPAPRRWSERIGRSGILGGTIACDARGRQRVPAQMQHRVHPRRAPRRVRSFTTMRGAVWRTASTHRAIERQRLRAVEVSLPNLDQYWTPARAAVPATRATRSSFATGAGLPSIGDQAEHRLHLSSSIEEPPMIEDDWPSLRGGGQERQELRRAAGEIR